jgi:Leu/Phe-tRNA-protein transferase
MPIPRADGSTLKQAIREHVDRSATIMTDELHSYREIGREFTEGHFTVTHNHREFVCRVLRDDGPDAISANTAESYAALLKRGHSSIFHDLSKKHLTGIVMNLASGGTIGR